MNEQKDKVKISPHEKIGIIYSIPNIGKYNVIVVQGDGQTIPQDSNDKIRFSSLTDARVAVKEMNVYRAYLALDKTYEEPVLPPETNKYNSYDYLPLALYNIDDH